MQSRLAIVLMSVAGTAALFAVGFLLGLGVMSTPKPGQHKEIALTTTPTKVARSETTGSGQPSDHPLTPLTPVAPGGAAAQAATPVAPAPQPQQTATAAPTPPVAPEQPKANESKAQDTKQAPAPVQTAKAEPAPAPQASPAANATPVSLERRNACDVAACSRAYRSFRESDCTYQPFSGPRQVCVGPPGAKDASRGRDDRQALRGGDDNEPSARIRVHRPGRDVELSNVVHEVERVTDGRRARDDDEDPPNVRRYHRDFTADGEDDRVEPADVGRHRSFFFDQEDDDQ